MLNFNHTPETRIINDYYNEKLTLAEELVYKKTRDKFNGLNEDDFINEPYPKDVVTKDKNDVANNERKFTTGTMRSEILEAVLLEQIEASEWLGENCYTIKMSKYDDYFNHVDFVIEWPGENGGKPIRLAVDVTMSDDDKLTEKLERIKKELLFDKGANIKYFSSETTKEKGALANIPRIIFGLTKEKLGEICELVAKTIRREPGSNKELAKNSLQTTFIKEMIGLLNGQISYSEKHVSPDSEILKNLVAARNHLKIISENKKGLVKANNYFNKSPMAIPVATKFNELTG